MKASEQDPHSLDIREILEEIRAALGDLYKDNLNKIILYGSYSRGEEQAESDVDIAVVLNESFDLIEEIERIIEVTYDIGLKYGKHLSIRPIYSKEYEDPVSPFLENVRNEGLIL